MPNVVVGVDPGKVIGACAFKGDSLYMGGEFRGLGEISKFIEAMAPDVVVVEEFYMGSAKVNYREPIQVIGAVKLTCEVLGIPVVMQSPGILQQTKHLTKGLHPSRHVRSAASHVLYYLNERCKDGTPKRTKRPNDPNRGTKRASRA